jgi:hypothetical protein
MAASPGAPRRRRRTTLQGSAASRLCSPTVQSWSPSKATSWRRSVPPMEAPAGARRSRSPTSRPTLTPAASAAARSLRPRLTARATSGWCGKIAVSAAVAPPTIWFTALRATACNWSAVTRVPIDPTTSVIDHFIPGIGIDPETSGSSAHVAITYYFYTNTSCTRIHLHAQRGLHFVTQWRNNMECRAEALRPHAAHVAAQSQNGLMVGDYIATAFTNGVPHGVFAVAAAKSGSTFNESMYTAQGLTADRERPTVLLRRRQAAASTCPIQLRKSSRKKA